MEYIAARGYDVYLLDLRGYGKSTRPKEMGEEAAKNPPLVRGDTAVKESARWSISCWRGATSRASICSAGRGAPP